MQQRLHVLLLLLSRNRRRRTCFGLPHGNWSTRPSFLPNQNSSLETVSSYQRGRGRGGTTSFPSLAVEVVVGGVMTRGHGDEKICVKEFEVPDNPGVCVIHMRIRTRDKCSAV